MLFVGVINKLPAAVFGWLVSFTVTAAPAHSAPAKELTAEPMPRSDGQWMPATASSCEDTCDAEGLRAVSSGFYTNGEQFFVCATDYNNEGFRPGYNLRPWDDKCVVGWGGQEVNGIPYVCLCQ
jgi:hypothetical protein